MCNKTLRVGIEPASPWLLVGCFNHCIITTTLLSTGPLVKLLVSSDDPMYALFLNFKHRGTPWLTSNFTDDPLASRVVVMVQWLAHPTTNQGGAGSIPTHGITCFSFKMDQLVVCCRYLYTHHLTFE